MCRWVCRDFPDLKLAVEKFILNSFEPTRSVGDTALPFVCVVDELYASHHTHKHTLLNVCQCMSMLSMYGCVLLTRYIQYRAFFSWSSFPL